MTLRQRLTHTRLWAEGIWAILTRNEMRLVVVAKELGQLNREVRVGGGATWGFHTVHLDGHRGCSPYECRRAPAEPTRKAT